MKKTRVLAVLLCVMMVMTILPAWQVSAEVTTYDSIDDIVGVAVAASKNYNFTAANAETLYGSSGCGCDFNETSFDTENGMTLSGTAPRWRIGGNNSSSLGSEKAIYFRAKVDTGKSATLYFHVPDTTADQDAYEVSITPEAVKKGAWTAATQVTPFVPGTGFVDYLAVDKEDGNGLNVYAKSADQYDGKWVCVLNVPAPNGNLSSTSEVYFSGQCSVQEVILYSKAPDSFDGVDQIMGKTMYAEKTFDMTNTDYKNESGFIFKPQGEHTAENGATIYNTDGGNGFWRYNSGTASWSPVTVGSRAVYFLAKVTEGQMMEVLVQSPVGGTEYGSFQISPTAFGENNFTKLDFARDGGAGTDFVEYIVVAETATKINLYAKGLTNDGKWILVATASGYAQSDNANIGLYFAGNGYLKKVILYSDTEPEGGGSGGTSFDTIEGIAGVDTLYTYKEFNFTSATAGDDYSGSAYDQNETAYDTESGMTLSGSASRWRYWEADSWSAIDEGRLIYFRAKVSDQNGGLVIFFKQPCNMASGDETAYTLKVAANGVTSDSAAVVSNPFIPGNEWAEYVIAKTETGMAAFSKRSSGKWEQILHTTATSNISTSSALYFTGQGSISKAVIHSLTQPGQGGGGATGDGSSFDSIEGIAGAETIYIYKDFNFASATAGDDYSSSIYDQTETTYDTTSGLTLFDSNLEDAYVPRWRWAESDSWSAIDEGRVVYFKAKLNSADENMLIYFKQPGDESEKKDQAYTIKISASAVTSDRSAVISNPLAPGTNWVEYVIAKTQTGMALFYKNASGKWIQVLHTTATSGISATSALYFTTGGSIQRATIYSKTEPNQGGGGEGGEGGGGTTPPVVVPPSTDSHNSIKDVTGRNMTLDIGFDMRKDNFTSGGASYMLTSHLTYDSSNGMGINGGYWRYTPINYYMPITVGDKVAFFRGKVANTSGEYGVLFQGPAGGKARSYIGIKSNSIRVAEGAMHYKKASFTPGTDWTDYLLVADTEESWTMYALNASTGYKWTAVLQGGYGNGGGPSTGLYFTGQGYIKEAAVYKSGTSSDAGATYTPDEIFGEDILEEYKKLTFDSNFDGAAENAGAKNVSTGADLAPYDIGENGLELKNTGTNEYFAWNYGTTNSWMPLGTRTPVAFRAKMESGAELGVQIGGGESAKLLLTPSGARVDGVLGMTSNYAIGTDWVNYLLMTDGATIKLYARGDNETNWTLVANPERFSLGGYYGILLSNTKSATTYVSSVEQAQFARPTLTDRDKIYELNGKIYLDETEPATTIDMTEVDPRGTWYIRTKVTLTGAEGVSGLFRNNGKKISWKLTTSSIAVGDEGAETAKPVELATGEQHEILFVYDFNKAVTVYVRKNGATEWTKTHEAVATVLATGLDDLVLTETAGNVDELQIYSGDLFRVTNMTIGGGNFRLSGEYMSGTSDSLYKRNATVLAVAYDKTYGYTSFVGAKEYEAEGGVMLNIAENFPASGISTGSDNLGAMIWDNISGGLALADGVGAMTENKATGKPETNQQPGLTASERYNGVRITGYAGGAGVPVVASLVDANGILRGAIQTRANADGMVDTEVAVDPALPNGTYTLMVQYGSAKATTKQVTLYGENVPYNNITTVADMESFLNQYGSDEVKTLNREAGFAADVLARFNEIKGDTVTFANLYEFREVMDKATDGEVRERNICNRVNAAVEVERWNDIQKLLLETYAADLGLSVADVAGVYSIKNLFLRMKGGYTSAAQIVSDFRAAVAAQKLAESNSGSGDSGVSGGGFAGGGAGGGGGFVGPNTEISNAFDNVSVDSNSIDNGSVPTVEGAIEFNDLTTVPWAQESIKKLQTMRVVSGDGDGTFAPNRAVTREEFLKMAMQVAGIQAKTGTSLSFYDVNANEWYYPYVAAAYEAGIIKGQSEEYFGIGQQITRSDMAVILKRILDYKGILLTEIKAAFVFDDFDTIPDYARESIALLSEAGLMNGVGDNTFQGAASATRAESAVAILRIYNYIEERR